MSTNAGPERQSASAPLRVAIIGNPNTGKTTLFNALTGLRQRVGNFAGVTVGRVDAVPAFNPGLSPSRPGDAPGAVTVMVIPAGNLPKRKND